jgi:hypothetical protein
VTVSDDPDVLAAELVRAGGRFRHPADAGVGDDALDLSSHRDSAISLRSGGRPIGAELHGLQLKGLSNAAQAAIDGGADSNAGIGHFESPDE